MALPDRATRRRTTLLPGMNLWFLPDARTRSTTTQAMEPLERSTRRARIVSNLLVVTLVVSAGLTAGLTTAFAPSTRSATTRSACTSESDLRFSDAGFAGYVSRQPVVREAGATVTVPTLYSGKLGSASTWIGVQAANCFFLQVGVLEYLFQTSSGPRAEYIPFWSDTALGFVPYTLPRQPAVNYGDRLRLVIRQNSSGWILAIDDLTSEQGASLHTRFGSGVEFNQAEWTQEDPSLRGDPLGHQPYPDLGVTRFADLSVNGVKPHLERYQASDMDVGGWGDVVPSALQHGGFETHVATGAAYRYLALVAVYNSVLDKFFSTIDDRRLSHTNVEELQTVVNVEPAQFAADLPGAMWPASLRPDIDKLLSADSAFELRAYRAWDTGTLRSSESILVRLEQQAAAAASFVRVRLGLAPPNRVAGFDDLGAN